MRDDELEELLISEAPRLLGLARRLAPQGIDAADLVQDTAERAWAARAQVTDRDRAPAWLRRILVNRLRDLARRRALIAFSALETAGDPPDITVQDPLAVLQTVEREGQLRAALRTLPGDELLAVVLHDSEGWSAADVAAICGCSTAAAHKRLQRGRMRLTGALAAAAGSQPDIVDDSCHAARQLASAYLDGDLDQHQIRQVDEHLGTCACCPPVLQALQGVVAALAKEPQTAPVEGLLDAFRAEIADARLAGA
jgi:RNA polymerase sigma-70 factor (ECF subfamily)